VPVVTVNEVESVLRTHGIAPTPQRIAVAKAILSRPQHLSAEQVIAGLRAEGARVSKATVYNTLNLFCERGLLRTVNVDPTRQYYDPTIEPHHHFYNVDTGELTDIPPDAVKLDLATSLPAGTVQAGVDVIIRVRGSEG
jgi:Fur family transcriptional regulator, iron response regulator